MQPSFCVAASHEFVKMVKSKIIFSSQWRLSPSPLPGAPQSFRSREVLHQGPPHCLAGAGGFFTRGLTQPRRSRGILHQGPHSPAGVGGFFTRGIITQSEKEALSIGASEYYRSRGLPGARLPKYCYVPGLFNPMIASS
jgi:hypothetical protein